MIEARIKLVDAGWQPMLNHWSYGGEPHLQYGNGLHVWEKGYHEIINASGTGLAHCAFEFQDVYGNRLVIATAGEVIDDLSTTAYVWSWYFADRDDT